MRLLFMPHGHTAQTHPHLLGQGLQGGAGAGVQSHLPCAIVMSFATNKHPMNLL